MRRNRTQCPSCKAEVGPNYRFCLACGAELELADQPLPAAEPEKKKRKKREPNVATPLVTAPPVSPGQAEAALDTSGPTPKGRSSRRLRVLLVLLIVVAGGIGATTYWNARSSSAADGFSWETISEFDFSLISNVWNGEDGPAEPDLLAAVPPGAIEARAIAVAEDGAVTLRVNGKDVPVRLAGVPPDFADQCLGEKAVSRLNRLLPRGAVVYALLDGRGRIGSSDANGPQMIYLWALDAEANRMRFANQELISSGEAEFVAVTVNSTDAGKELGRASKRAQAKQRGRYEPGSCS